MTVADRRTASRWRAVLPARLINRFPDCVPLRDDSNPQSALWLQPR